MNELSLFTGAGGGIWGSKLLGWRTVGYVEIDSYCQKVLAQRIEDKIFDYAPIFSDIREFINQGYAERYRGVADVITAGFPCQPFSCAGRRKGEDDERNLWPQTRDCIDIVRPHYALLENVPGLVTSGYFGTVIGELTALGYDCRWTIISAAELGAPHIRKRLWILATNAYGTSGGIQSRWGGRPIRQDATYPEHDGQEKYVADSTSARRGEGRKQQGRSIRDEAWRQGPERCDWWSIEPGMGRVADGIPGRGKRIKALGNAQVPRMVVEAWERLSR